MKANQIKRIVLKVLPTLKGQPFTFGKSNFISISLTSFLFLLLATSCQQGNSSPEANIEKGNPRIISLSGFLTETLTDLGYTQDIVGKDVTSTYPETVKDIPNLGHVTQLNVEAIIELNPDIIFIEAAQLGQAENIKQLEKAGIELAIIPTSQSFDNAYKASKAIGQYINIDQVQLDQMAAKIEADSLKLADKLNQITEQPKVLFIYARGAGRLTIAGTNTSSEAIIEKAGGQNAVTAFEGFKALTPEALIEASPDAILMFESGLASLDGKEGLEQIPGIAQTPAFQNDRIITMDGHYLLSFSARSGQAANDLANQLHTENYE